MSGWSIHSFLIIINLLTEVWGHQREDYKMCCSDIKLLYCKILFSFYICSLGIVVLCPGSLHLVICKICSTSKNYDPYKGSSEEYWVRHVASGQEETFQPGGGTLFVRQVEQPLPLPGGWRGEHGKQSIEEFWWPVWAFKILLKLVSAGSGETMAYWGG